MKPEYVYFQENSQTPYCDLVIEGNTLHLSGLISMDMGTGEELYGDVVYETKVILSNLKRILENYGSDMKHVVRAVVLLADFRDRDKMNEEYVRHFDAKHMPARLCYGNVGIYGQCKVEIMIDAVKK